MAACLAGYGNLDLMKWQIIKSTLCEGRDFTLTDQGCRVRADTMMPSGGCIEIHIQSRMSGLYLHDGGAAFDEMARHALEVKSTGGLKRMLAQTGFGLTDNGEVFRDGFSIDKVAIGVALVADASLRAASFMASHSKRPASFPIDRKVKDALRLRYPTGRPDFHFNGKNRQHKFDFGVTVDGETFLVQSVTPDMSSVSSAVLKAIDAKEAPDVNVRPILVFDRNAGWNSGELNMLEFGGTGMELARIEKELLPLAA